MNKAFNLLEGRTMVQDLNIAYIGTFYPHHARMDLLEMKEMGCTSINMCVNEADWSYYRFSRHEIRKVAKELGLKVILNFHGFGSFASTFPGHYYQTNHPEAVQISNKGSRASDSCCPNNPDYRSWLKTTLTEIIQDIKPDGIFWDEPRFSSYDHAFPEEWGCCCQHCMSKFKTLYGEDIPQTATPQVMEFRQNSLLHFLDELLIMAKEIDQNLENNLCLMPLIHPVASMGDCTGWFGVVDLEPFVALDSVDVFSTDPYWIQSRDWAYFENCTLEALELAKKYKKPCQIWVQSIWIEPGKEHLIGETIRRADELGVDRIAVWAFRGESGSHRLNYGSNPDDCWSQVTQAYKELAVNIKTGN
jgi:hypothetical protein